jgi:hypothetical protein
MANKSDWKGFEKMVATALGGKRRFRTMEDAGSYATEAPDVYFPKWMRKKYPILKKVAVECKKRRSLNVHLLFAEAVSKYGKDGANHIVFASKTPRGRLKKSVNKLKADIEKRYRIGGPIWKRLVKKIKKKLKKKGRLFEKKHALMAERRLKSKRQRAWRFGKARLRAKHSIAPLVTVELQLFKELWWAWLKSWRMK